MTDWTQRSPDASAANPKPARLRFGPAMIGYGAAAAVSLAVWAALIGMAARFF
jgi:hypothetical protein